MRGDKIGVRQAIAVKKDAKLARTRDDAAVTDLTAAETAMLMANVLQHDRQPRAPILDKRLGRQTGAIVGDDNFEIAVGLPRQRAQDCIERVFAIIGRDDDGDERRAAHDEHPFLDRPPLLRSLSSSLLSLLPFVLAPVQHWTGHRKQASQAKAVRISEYRFIDKI